MRVEVIKAPINLKLNFYAAHCYAGTYLPIYTVSCRGRVQYESSINRIANNCKIRLFILTNSSSCFLQSPQASIGIIIPFAIGHDSLLYWYRLANLLHIIFRSMCLGLTQFSPVGDACISEQHAVSIFKDEVSYVSSEFGDSMFLRNVGIHLQNYTVSQPKIYQSDSTSLQMYILLSCI
jgi:hypothetical protein